MAGPKPAMRQFPMPAARRQVADWLALARFAAGERQKWILLPTIYGTGYARGFDTGVSRMNNRA